MWPLNQQHGELFKRCEFWELTPNLLNQQHWGGAWPSALEQAWNKLPVCAVPSALGTKEGGHYLHGMDGKPEAPGGAPVNEPRMGPEPRTSGAGPQAARPREDIAYLVWPGHSGLVEDSVSFLQGHYHQGSPLVAETGFSWTRTQPCAT